MSQLARTPHCTHRDRRTARTPLSGWLVLAGLALFALVGIGDPSTASAEPAVATGALSALPSLGTLGAGPNTLVLLGLAGLLIFPDKIAPGRRSPRR